MLCQQVVDEILKEYSFFSLRFFFHVSTCTSPSASTTGGDDLG